MQQRGLTCRNRLSIVLALTFVASCAAVRSHRELEQPLGSQLVASVGSTIFRLNKLGDLPNVVGGRDIYGGKVDRGFAEIKLVAIDGKRLTYHQAGSSDLA